MPNIYIDGQKISAKAGETIIQAAYNHGIEVPHFCWHPELSVAGNCRMCLVEVGMPKKLPDGSTELDAQGNPTINYIPKLQIACSTIVADEMYVNLNKDNVIKAKEAVMEFLLINHPLDCPICDEAGECKLQDYAFRHSNGESRFDEKKNQKPKRQQWGPNVFFDAERCISCSRCIRFAQEVADQDVLTFVNRGDHVTIQIFEGKQWDNPYSMNVIEICPVGALTSKDFRFKSRVWEMSFNPSITANDSSGANILVGVRNNKILRIEPNTNMYVNRYWLTDEQRLNFKYVNENRVTEPMIRVENSLQKTSWEDAFKFTAEKFSKFSPEEIFVLGSGLLSNECAYALSKFSKNVLKTKNIGYLKHENASNADNFLGKEDKTPNRTGLDEFGYNNIIGQLKTSDLSEAIASRKIKALYIVEEDFSYHEDLFNHFDNLELIVVHSYNYNRLTDIANIVLPASTFAEIEGTYTNDKRRVQYLSPLLVTNENRANMGMKMSRNDKFGAFNDRWTQHEIRNCRQTWRIVQGIANSMGGNWNYKKSKDVFNEIASTISSFRSMNYDKIKEFQGLVLGKGDNPDPKLPLYDSHLLKPQSH